jgi:hypothetical protein
MRPSARLALDLAVAQKIVSLAGSAVNRLCDLGCTPQEITADVVDYSM